MRVSEIMNAEFSTITPEATLPAVTRALTSRPQRLLYVVDDHRKLLGVISTIDVLHALAPSYLDAHLARSLPIGFEMTLELTADNLHRTASEIMRESVISLDSDDHFHHAEALLRQNGLVGMPVLDPGGVLVGEVTCAEILGMFAGAIEKIEMIEKVENDDKPVEDKADDHG